MRWCKKKIYQLYLILLSQFSFPTAIYVYHSLSFLLLKASAIPIACWESNQMVARLSRRYHCRQRHVHSLRIWAVLITTPPIRRPIVNIVFASVSNVKIWDDGSHVIQLVVQCQRSLYAPHQLNRTRWVRRGMKNLNCKYFFYSVVVIVLLLVSLLQHGSMVLCSLRNKLQK